MMQDKFQEIALGGLLHDIGKFYGRSSEVVRERTESSKTIGYAIKHPYYSSLFLDVIKENLTSLKLDIDLLKRLVHNHHEHPTFGDDYLVKSVSNPSEQLLALIVSRADSYSSQERRETKSGFPDYKKALMHSPFSRVKIDTEESLIDKHLLPSNLYSFNSLNDFAKKITPQDQAEVLQVTLDKLVENFANKAKQIKAKNFNELFNALLSLIYQFCWAICADAREEIRDVSLYDHLKTTSALATCLYLFHLETASLSETAIANENEEKFLLIGGDLSGIQNYLYDIANINAKAVAKIPKPAPKTAPSMAPAMILAKVPTATTAPAGGATKKTAAPPITPAIAPIQPPHLAPALKRCEVV
jgi:CRISPR-associated protein Csm1